MPWKKSGYGSTILDIVTNKSGLTEEELLEPQRVNSSTIQNLKEAAVMIVSAIRAGEHITVFGDYDADGITATCILVNLLHHLRADVSYRLPRRMSEGYGINLSAVNEIQSGLLITVDNGIAAIDEIAAAKEKGLRVIVIDHHLPGETLPPADLIVDPHIDPENNGFEDYCGAGLSLKLAELFLSAEKKKNPESVRTLFYRFVALAAVATIADVVPLRGENRWIVMQGLKLLSKRDKSLPFGLVMLMNEFGLGEKITETDIGFKIGPALNAPGRVEDIGAEKALQLLLTNDLKDAERRCKNLLEINDFRKRITKDAVAEAERQIKENPSMLSKAPLCLVLKGVPEGLVGIVTGRLAEKYRVPAFAFVKTSEGFLKGSGRSYGGVNLKELTDICKDLLIAGGGHADAAGVSISEENYEKMLEKMQEHLKDYHAEDTETLVYDMEISDSQIAEAYREVQTYAPYGEGNPAPVFVVNAMLTPRGASHFRLMGEDQSHVKLYGNNFSAIAFGLASKFAELGSPYKVQLLGKLSEASFRFSRELQLEAQDLEAQASPEKPKLFQSISKIEKL